MRNGVAVLLASRVFDLERAAAAKRVAEEQQAKARGSAAVKAAEPAVTGPPSRARQATSS